MASIGWIGALLAEPHDRALAELLFDLADGQVDGLGAFAVLTLVSFNCLVGMCSLLLSKRSAILNSCRAKVKGIQRVNRQQQHM